MLNPQRNATDAFDDLRATEFARLDEQGVTYLDYTGAALYGASQAASYAERLTTRIYGNPHSAHVPSAASERELETARAATLRFFDADPQVYDVCFTANASAAIKLVAESYPFTASRGLVVSADNHNSVNGIREFARRVHAPVTTVPLCEELRLVEPEAYFARFAAAGGEGLFAFPALSNFSGVRHSLELVHHAHRHGLDVLIDAAGTGVLGGVSLTKYPAEFLAFSFYKIFGLPTGVGALIAKRTALSRLCRPWFAGGTVDFVSIEHDRHQLRRDHAGFEDGTPNFLNVGAIETGFAFLEPLDRIRLRHRLLRFVRRFMDEARAFEHRNGTPRVRIYGPANDVDRGCTVAFNLVHDDGSVVPYQIIEQQAAEAGIALRGGCFCNPGAAEHAFEFANRPVRESLEALGDSFTIPRFQERLGAGATVGALRLSVGLPTIDADIDRVLAFIEATG